MKKIAVIGAGFSGLLAAIHLQKEADVVVFDGNQPHEKASLIASGIIQPFLGHSAKPAWYWEEALSEAFSVFDEAKRYASTHFLSDVPIIRIPMAKETENQLHQLSQQYPFVHFVEKLADPVKTGLSGYQIDRSKTVFAEAYLQALENWFRALGGIKVERQIYSLKEIEPDFDHIVVAAGKNSGKLLNSSSLSFHKGEILLVKAVAPFKMHQSLTGKGYLALTEKSNQFVLGSTYEHQDKTNGPTLAGRDQILSQAQTYLKMELFEVIEGKSAFRVTKKNQGVPYVQLVSSKYSVLTAMGSRGLLYHALCAKILKEAILNQRIIETRLTDL